jgi:hypothetical protein
MVVMNVLQDLASRMMRSDSPASNVISSYGEALGSNHVISAAIKIV